MAGPTCTARIGGWSRCCPVPPVATRGTGGHDRTDDRENGQRRLDDEIHTYRLAEVRRNRALTQREVAEAMGVSGPRVSDMERGKLDVVSVSMLRAYVEALDRKLKITAEFDDSSQTVA